MKSLSPVPSATDYPSIHKRSITFGADLARDRGQLIQLIGAVKQREYSEEIIITAEKQRAQDVDVLIDKLNAIEVERGQPWYKKIF